MNKKYIKQFFNLTEQNLLGYQISANDSFEDTMVQSADVTQGKTKMYPALTPVQYISIGLLALLSSGIFALLMKPHHQEQSRQPTNREASYYTKKVVLEPQQWSSFIPSYRDGSKRQYMQAISLRRTDRVSIDQERAENRYAAIEPMVDKVIVTPKSFG